MVFDCSAEPLVYILTFFNWWRALTFYLIYLFVFRLRWSKLNIIILRMPTPNVTIVQIKKLGH